MPMLIFEETEMLLNRHASAIEGRELSFFVQYWGVKHKHFDNPLHRHTFFEVCYVLNGEGTYREEEQVYSLNEGTLFCSRPGVQHQISSEQGLSLLYVAFEIDKAKSQEEAVRQYSELIHSNKVLLDEQSKSVAVLLWLALMELVDTKYVFEEALTSTAHALLLSFYRAFVENDPEEQRLEHNPSAGQLKQAKLFIRDNLAQPLLLTDVASYMHISARHLSRLFANELGKTFSTYIRHERLRQAKVLLSETNLSMKQIAEKTGFGTIHYFTRVFCAEVGIPPGEYRKNIVK